MIKNNTVAVDNKGAGSSWLKHLFHAAIEKDITLAGNYVLS